jgi:diguanylate cyclase (GGDEF)-like protein
MRERILLFGDPGARPAGMERTLIRAGFALFEDASADSAVPPDLVLVAVRDTGSELERILGVCRSRGWLGVPVIALLGTCGPGAITRALSMGTVDAIPAPVDLAELPARLEARLRYRAEVVRAAGADSLRADFFLAIGAVAASRRPDELLEQLVGRIGAGLGAGHCACLVPSADGRYARVVAVHENPAAGNLTVELFHYPEAVEAIVSGRTVYAPEVLRDGLFLAHLAQWPDSPEVRDIESTAAVPVIIRGAMQAVLVIRTRRGEPPLAPEQVAAVEHLVNSAAALLEREDRRAEGWRGEDSATAIDRLTGCGTSEALSRRLRLELDRAARYHGALALVLLGIDALRELVLRLGPEAGGPLLAELGALLNQEVRSPDFVARYGADQFAILMPSTGESGARRVIQRLAIRLDTRLWSQFPLTRRPRLAAGIAVFPHPDLSRIEDLVAAAEAGLKVENGGTDPAGRTAA